MLTSPYRGCGCFLFGGVNLFRDCCFEYAGKYSGDFNLVMEFIENNYDKFDSGGKYDIISDALPMSKETLLYGLKYSEKPLEFSVEIINPDENIPFNQMLKIKDWLFGQDGWKELRLESEEYHGYYLKCLLMPDEDITDATGYRGVRCTIKNMSGFWYGDNINISFNSEKLKELTGENGELLDENGYLNTSITIESNSSVIEKILPTISFKTDELNGMIRLSITNLTNKSSVYIDIDETCLHKRCEVNMQYLYTIINNETSTNIISFNTNLDIFYLSKGRNELEINMLDTEDNFVPFTSICFSYTPTYRIGGF